jgi:hypothetical protein
VPGPPVLFNKRTTNHFRTRTAGKASGMVLAAQCLQPLDTDTYSESHANQGKESREREREICRGRKEAQKRARLHAVPRTCPTIASWHCAQVTLDMNTGTLRFRPLFFVQNTMLTSCTPNSSLIWCSRPPFSSSQITRENARRGLRILRFYLSSFYLAFRGGGLSLPPFFV